MDTPIIAQYYREHDPMKRKELLEQSIAAGECPEENQIRKELWEIRYAEASKVEKENRADGFLALWMTLEFNKDAGKKLFGFKGAQKEISKHLSRLQFNEYQKKGGLYEEILYRECCHLVQMYVELCETDKSYNTTLCGIVSIGKDKAKQKIQKDIYETAINLPPSIKMEEELGIITRAAREVFELHFPGEGGI
nr:DUF6553 family protein [uncultured Blautia sp.]